MQRGKQQRDYFNKCFKRISEIYSSKEDIVRQGQYTLLQKQPHFPSLCTSRTIFLSIWELLFLPLKISSLVPCVQIGGPTLTNCLRAQDFGLATTLTVVVIPNMRCLKFNTYVLGNPTVFALLPRMCVLSSSFVSCTTNALCCISLCV